jgi:hypothetical protein
MLVVKKVENFNEKDFTVNVEFLVHIRGKCKQVFIPKGYCTVFLRNRHEEDIEVNEEGDDICIQDLSQDLPCQQHEEK